MHVPSFNLRSAETRFRALVAVATLSLAGLLTAPAAHAQVVYDNGGFADLGGWDLTAYISADDFTLTAPLTTFDAIRFWMADTSAGVAGDFSGTLTWAVRADNGGIPGAALFSGTTSDVTVADTGSVLFNIPAFEIAQMDFSITEVALLPGTYWLSIKENGPLDGNDGSSIFWVNTGAQTGATLKQDADEVAPAAWAEQTEPNDLAFQLRGAAVAVPEVSTLALALPALGMIALCNRVGAVIVRRRRSVCQQTRKTA